MKAVVLPPWGGFSAKALTSTGAVVDADEKLCTGRNEIRNRSRGRVQAPVLVSSLPLSFGALTFPRLLPPHTYTINLHRPGFACQGYPFVQNLRWWSPTFTSYHHTLNAGLGTHASPRQCHRICAAHTQESYSGELSPTRQYKLVYLPSLSPEHSRFGRGDGEYGDGLEMQPQQLQLPGFPGLGQYSKTIIQPTDKAELSKVDECSVKPWWQDKPTSLSWLNFWEMNWFSLYSKLWNSRKGSYNGSFRWLTVPGFDGATIFFCSTFPALSFLFLLSSIDVVSATGKRFPVGATACYKHTVQIYNFIFRLGKSSFWSHQPRTWRGKGRCGWKEAYLTIHAVTHKTLQQLSGFPAPLHLQCQKWASRYRKSKGRKRAYLCEHGVALLPPVLFPRRGKKRDS